MTTATATKTASGLITAGDLLRLCADGVRGELIRGVLSETTPTGREHGQIAARLVVRLGNFVQPRKLGILTVSDSGVQLEHNPDTVREPDVAFFSAEKSPPDERVTGYAQVAPDLAVEIVSPSDRLPAVNDKALMWLRYGFASYGSCAPTSGVSTSTATAIPSPRSRRATRSTGWTRCPASPVPSARYSGRARRGVLVEAWDGFDS